MKSILTVSLIILLVVTISAQNSHLARGFVFDDKNKNGILDDGEKGIEGVLVSNQEDVVLTDSKGYYELSIKNPGTIFITKPANYNVPLNDFNNPQFYYIHQPDGSKVMEFEGISKTGELPESINFPLYETIEKDNFRLLALADVQVASAKEIDYFRQDFIPHLLNEKFDLSISLGDLVHDDLSLFQGYNQSVALLNTPAYNIIGNHDVNYDVNEPFSSDTYKSFYGPNYYSFDYGQVHFVCLKNFERLCKKGDTERYWNCYEGQVNDKQLKWLKNDLKNTSPDKLVVICQHVAFEKNSTTGERMKVKNRQEVFDVLKDRKNLLVLAGHKHTLQHDYFTKEDGWKGKDELHQIVCASVSGSWWSGPIDKNGVPTSTQIDGVPNGYFIFEFKGNKFVHHFHPAGNSAEQMRIEFPEEKINTENMEIIVNVFNSNKYSTVFAELDNLEKVELKNEISKDPFISSSFANPNSNYKSWASPSNSTQIWKGQLPVDMSKGLHNLKITSVDEFKREFTSYKVFEVSQ